MKTPSYEGKQVYIGLDVHREFFVASCICDGVVVKRCRMLHISLTDRAVESDQTELMRGVE